jgi:hypothetical protein
MKGSRSRRRGERLRVLLLASEEAREGEAKEGRMRRK